jgi:hypothetical protein
MPCLLVHLRKHSGELASFRPKMLFTRLPRTWIIVHSFRSIRKAISDCIIRACRQAMMTFIHKKYFLRVLFLSFSFLQTGNFFSSISQGKAQHIPRVWPKKSNFEDFAIYSNSAVCGRINENKHGSLLLFST